MLFRHGSAGAVLKEYLYIFFYQTDSGARINAILNLVHVTIEIDPPLQVEKQAKNARQKKVISIICE